MIVPGRKDTASRFTWKLRLIRGLYDRGWTVEDVRQLFRLIDWMMALPMELQGKFRSEMYHFEEERHMPYLSSFERLAKEEGRAEAQAEALQKTVLRLGKLRIGKPSKQIVSAVGAITDVDRLERLTEKILQATTWQELLDTP